MGQRVLLMGYTYCVEKERAKTSVGFLTYVDGREPVYSLAIEERGFSTILLTAALSVVALVAALGLQIERGVQEKRAATSFVAVGTPLQGDNGTTTGTSAAGATSAGTAAVDPAASSAGGVSPIGAAVLSKLVGSYTTLKGEGIYTPEVGQKIAEGVAATLKTTVSYTTYTASDTKTDPDTSYTRMLSYRSDLRNALAPLLKNTEPEYEIFAYYVSTKDKTYLTKLAGVAQNYRDAAAATLQIVAPIDAATEHIAILNAMEEFAATLDALVANADDPFGSVALLRTYNQAEQDVLTSFNALATYEKQKQP